MIFDKRLNKRKYVTLMIYYVYSIERTEIYGIMSRKTKWKRSFLTNVKIMISEELFRSPWCSNFVNNAGNKYKVFTSTASFDEVVSRATRIGRYTLINCLF